MSKKKNAKDHLSAEILISMDNLIADIEVWNNRIMRESNEILNSPSLCEVLKNTIKTMNTIEELREHLKRLEHTI